MCVNKYFKAMVEFSSFVDYVNSNISFRGVMLNSNTMTWYPIVLSIQIKKTFEGTIYPD